MIAQLFDTAPCGYFSFFDDGNFFVGNQTFHALTGYNSNELANKNVNTFFTLATRIFYETHLFPIIKLHGQAAEIFITLLTKNQQHLPVLLNAKLADWEGRRLITCAFIVVPNRKKFEDELVSARKEAQEALKENSDLAKAKAELHGYTEQLDQQIRTTEQQNQELKQFTHVVTHSLREPLRKILIYSEKLQAIGLSESVGPDIVRMTKAAVQLKSVVDGLQQYIWLTETANHITRVDLSQLVQKAVSRLGEEKAEMLSLTLHPDPLPSIEADASQIQQLFCHLLDNAVKFRKGEKAHVTITTTFLKRNWFRAVENKYRYEDFVKLEIRDEGLGFDATYKDTLFQIFRKLHYNEGQGLGLALSRLIASNHNGFIEADSKINEYSVFTVWLPVEPTV